MQPNSPEYNEIPQGNYAVPMQQPVMVLNENQVGKKSNPVLIAGLVLGVGLILIIFTIVVSGILYVWANSLAEETESSIAIIDEITIEVGEDTIFTSKQTACTESLSIEQLSYFACQFSLNENAEISIILDLDMNGDSIDLITMTQDNYELWEQGLDYNYFPDLSAEDTWDTQKSATLEADEEYVVVLFND